MYENNVEEKNRRNKYGHENVRVKSLTKRVFLFFFFFCYKTLRNNDVLC